MPRVLHTGPFLALWALSAFAEMPSPKLSPAVGVFMDFDSVPSSPSLRVMKDEVQKLLKPSGILLDWRLTKENHGDEAFSNLVVVKFKGKCKAERWPQPENELAPGEKVTMGKTLVDHGHVLPYTEVECDQVRKALGTLEPTVTQKERQNALGLAMARVLAHEIYHILARTTDHAREGLARAVHPMSDLMERHTLPFGKNDSDMMRNGAFGSLGRFSK